MPPHSKTVRGTLDNPHTKEAIAKGDNPQTVDPVSLRGPNQEGRDSSPDDTPGGFGKPADTYGLKKDAPSAPSSFENAKKKNKEKSHGDNYGLDKGVKSKL